MFKNISPDSNQNIFVNINQLCLIKEYLKPTDSSIIHIVDEPDEDETVKLVSIDIPDDLLCDLEDQSRELKSATIMHDPDRLDEDPRKDGWDFDYYAAWSDDVVKR